MESIFHLALEDQWQEAQSTGTYTWSTRGMTIDQVGYLHASFASQTDATAQRFYSDVEAPLVLLRLDPAHLNEHGLRVVVEPGIPNNPASEKFPHVYGGAIPVKAVAEARPYALPRPTGL